MSMRFTANLSRLKKLTLFSREVLRDYKIQRRNGNDNARASHFLYISLPLNLHDYDV